MYTTNLFSLFKANIRGLLRQLIVLFIKYQKCTLSEDTKQKVKSLASGHFLINLTAELLGSGLDTT